MLKGDPRMIAALLAALAVSAAAGDVPITWEPTFNISRSTVFMPCNYSGSFDPEVAGGSSSADTPSLRALNLSTLSV